MTSDQAPASESDAASDPAPLGPPVLRVVRGIPDGESGALEVAVLTAVLAARGGGAAPEPPAPNAWNPPAKLVRRPVHPSPDGWRLSALP